MRVTDLEKFSFEEIWRPFWPTYAGTKPGDPLPRITKAPHNLEDTALHLGMETAWRDQVISRLSAIGVTFPDYVQHPIVDILRELLRPNPPAEPLHGDRRVDRENGTCDFYCRIHGWVTVEWSNPDLRFTKEHNEKSGCTPLLTTLEDATALMVALAAENKGVGVFWDRGWGDSGEAAEISIITDGNGQNPHALITAQVYESLQAFRKIEPNSLTTFKARKYHEFTTPEAPLPSGPVAG